MARKSVDVEDVVIAKRAERLGVTPDEALQSLADQGLRRIKSDLIVEAFNGLSEADQIAALTAVNANPLAT